MCERETHTERHRETQSDIKRHSVCVRERDKERHRETDTEKKTATFSQIKLSFF